ncbi:GNAT family N-acetyltransferase [Aequorivita flava]|uniref:GNAT family N-acetyltransferase n=1 Tax=Aequorivita flava TaxID=3114371 RepID=A0AB35YR02_9FLAO
MIVKKLENIAFDIIADCFLKSFENYYVKIPSDKNYYKERWKIAKVDYAFSYGMFDGGKLVGFIINAIDTRNGEKIAFNTGTGVLPKYRGKQIVRSIYDFAIPDLKTNGVIKCALEVIIENSKAIKTYQSIGFNICKTFKCFSGEIKLHLNEKIELNEVDYNAFDWEKMPNQQLYSWDFNLEVIKKGNYKYYQLINDNLVESYFIINPCNAYIAQFEILKESAGCWQRLFKGIKEVSNSIKIINVDTRLNQKIDCISSIGLANTVNQYEMEMII